MNRFRPSRGDLIYIRKDFLPSKNKKFALRLGTIGKLKDVKFSEESGKMMYMVQFDDKVTIGCFESIDWDATAKLNNPESKALLNL